MVAIPEGMKNLACPEFTIQCERVKGSAWMKTADLINISWCCSFGTGTLTGASDAWYRWASSTVTSSYSSAAPIPALHMLGKRVSYGSRSWKFPSASRQPLCGDISLISYPNRAYYDRNITGGEFYYHMNMVNGIFADGHGASSKLNEIVNNKITFNPYGIFYYPEP